MDMSEVQIAAIAERVKGQLASEGVITDPGEWLLTLSGEQLLELLADVASRIEAVDGKESAVTALRELADDIESQEPGDDTDDGK